MPQNTMLEPRNDPGQYVEAHLVRRPPRNAGHEPWIEFHEYRRIVQKHLRLVIVIAAVCVGLTLMRDLMAGPTYTASTTLLIRYTPSRVFEDESVAAPQDSSQEPYDDTQSELLKSSSLATRVILDQGLMKLEARPSHAPGSWLPGWGVLRSTLAGWFPSLAAKQAAPTLDDPLADSVPRSVVQWYLGALQVKPIENTQLVQVEFTTSDPKLSARMANAHARAFIRQGIELSAQASDEAQRFLAGKLDELKQRVEQSEVALNNYRRDKDIVPGLISLNGSQDMVVEQLNKLNHDLQDAHLKTITLGTQLELVKAGHTDALPQVMDNKVIQGLKGDLDQLESRYASMRGEYTDEYREMRELREKIGGTRAVLDRELKTAVASVNEQYQAALKSEEAISAELDSQKGFALGLNDAAIKYVMLEREADTNRELYNAVLKRMKNLTIIGDAHASNVSVVDPAQPPLAPSSPRTRRDLVAAAALGLLLGICGALFIERLDNTLKTPEELERYLKLPGLATIPDFNSAISLGSRYRAGYLPKPAVAELPANGAHGRDLVATYGKYSVLGESFRQLRTALRLSRAGAPPKATMFTSAVPGEGKTTVAVNTASVFAQTGSKVLVIDADMRRPRCHRLLGLQNRLGLSEALTGAGGTELVQPTPVENLFFLSCGRIPPNPSELLGSLRMKEFLRELSETYDYIIIDSSPVMLVSDPLDLAQVVDGVVLVTAGGHTPRHQVAAALARLEYTNAKILGVVLNKVRLYKADFPHYYSKAYQGYYQGFDNLDADETSFEDASAEADSPKRASDGN
ncbi:GumC family protein [Candidatus Binatus sp.]|jgi:succinoglycan biosynthesis transport protein ExoP|uniref:GumC family protein n=1 Tax=Candidatus Binatus sp. TaxID=2811406 RepID=UPI003BC633D2